VITSQINNKLKGVLQKHDHIKPKRTETNFGFWLTSIFFRVTSSSTGSIFGICAAGYLWAWRHSSHPIKIKTQSSGRSLWPAWCRPFSYTTGLLMEGRCSLYTGFTPALRRQYQWLKARREIYYGQKQLRLWKTRQRSHHQTADGSTS